MAKVTNIANRRYWQVTKNNQTEFTGTHSECWDHLCIIYRDHTVAQLIEMGVKIKRIA